MYVQIIGLEKHGYFILNVIGMSHLCHPVSLVCYEPPQIRIWHIDLWLPAATDPVLHTRERSSACVVYT